MPVQIVVEPLEVHEKVDRSIKSRLTDRLAKQYCPVPTYFLKNYHRLESTPGSGGLNSSQVVFLIHLLDHKWDANDPYPSMGLLAKKMGLTRRGARKIASSLEGRKLIRRGSSASKSNSYNLQPLFDALHKMMDEDAKKEVK